MKKGKYFVMGAIGATAVTAAIALKKHIMPEVKDNNDNTAETFIAGWLNEQVSKGETTENILLSLYKMKDAVDTAINSLK